MSSDQRASILAVIEQEKRTVAYYKALLQAKTRPAWIARWRGLRDYHRAQMRRRRKELRQP